MLYCSPVCQEIDFSREGSDHSHKLWCDAMKKYMAKTNQLCQLPFTFAEETTSEDFDEALYRRFLEKQGVYNVGFWKREATQTTLQADRQSFVPYGELWEIEDGVVLPVESCVLNEPPEHLPFCVIDGWESYYRYRGFRLDSPVAILLQWPLTLYHVISTCLPVDYPGWSEEGETKVISIDIVGVEKEVELLPLFEEAGYLLGHITLDIHMFGAEIAKSVDQKHWEACNMKIKVIRGLYHNKRDNDRKPDLILGFNAGLGAYPSWRKTIEKLKMDRTPAYFTDFCQYSCECARNAIKAIGIGTVSNPIINPFRAPVRKLADENDMPWYSNGFLYHISYPP